MEQQPFYIGQAVVRLTDSTDLRYGKKGSEYTVQGLDKCPQCKKWFIDVGFRQQQHRVYMLSVCGCGEKTPMSEPIIWCDARSFAPIERTKTQYVIKEVEVAPAIREMEVQLS